MKIKNYIAKPTKVNAIQLLNDNCRQLIEFMHHLPFDHFNLADGKVCRYELIKDDAYNVRILFELEDDFIMHMNHGDYLTISNLGGIEIWTAKDFNRFFKADDDPVIASTVDDIIEKTLNGEIDISSLQNQEIWKAITKLQKDLKLIDTKKEFLGNGLWNNLTDKVNDLCEEFDTHIHDAEPQDKPQKIDIKCHCSCKHNYELCCSCPNIKINMYGYGGFACENYEVLE